MKNRMTDIEIQAEIDKRIKEAKKQHIIDHMPVVSIGYGNTYVSVKEYDEESASIMNRVSTLLDLMNVKYSVSAVCNVYDDYGYETENDYFFSIKGEDTERAAFIQKFIDNDTVLKWR